MKNLKHCKYLSREMSAAIGATWLSSIARIVYVSFISSMILSTHAQCHEAKLQQYVIKEVDHSVPNQSGFEMVVKPLHTIGKGDNPIVIDLEVRNISERSLGLAHTGTETQDFDITVTDSHGVPAPLTNYGKQFIVPTQFRFYRSTYTESFMPGQINHNYIWLNRMYDMTLSGDYTVKVKRSLPTLDGKGMADVVSNTVTITVLPTSDQEVAEEQFKASGQTPTSGQ